MKLWTPPETEPPKAVPPPPHKAPPASENMAQQWKREQEAIRQAGTQPSEIEKAITAGESYYRLLLRCLDCIGAMTGDSSFYLRTKEKLQAIHGAGLGKPEPLQDEITRIREQLERLRQTQQRETDPQIKSHMDEAVQAHSRRLKALEERKG